MERIIAGRFQTKDDADAAAALIGKFVASSDICIFHNNPPGQHDVLGTGGDENADPGAKGAGRSAATTALAAGLTAGAVGSLAGPAAAVASAGVGAYLGALAGAMDELSDSNQKPRKPERRPGGVMLSVRIAEPANEERVIDTLRAQAAADIEEADGEWRNGNWVDFDPVAVPRLVDAGASRSNAITT
jgi:hypothetical protein